MLHEIKLRFDLNNQIDKDGDAYCYITEEQLCEKANVGSRKTVEASIRRLEELNLVYRKFNGVKNCNSYFIAYPDKAENDEKALVDVNEIGKKLTDEQKAENKAKREELRKKKSNAKQIEKFNAEKMTITKAEQESVTKQIVNEFEALMKKAKAMGVRYYKAKRMPELTAIVEKHFGVGKKLVDATIKDFAKVSSTVSELEEKYHKN